MKIEEFRKHKVLNSIVFLFILVSIVYLVPFIYLQDKFMPNTTINGYDVSCKTVEQASQQIKYELINNYNLEIKKVDGTSEKLSAERINLKIEMDLNKIRNEQKTGYWPNYMMQTNPYKVIYKVVYNDAFLEDKLDEFLFLKEENMKHPTDAYISDYIAGKGYNIIPETKGNYINKKRFKDKIEDSILRLDKQFDIELNGCYERPNITSESKDLKNKLEKMNHVVSSIITYDFDDFEIVLNADTYHAWLSFTGEDIGVIEDAAAVYINELVKKTDTAYTERIFMTNSGKKIKVTGPYGYRIAKNDERKQLITDILSGKHIKRKPIYIREGASRTGNDYGNTYVEIDLTEQKVYLYVNDKQIKSSNCVTGNISRNHATPPGIYPLAYKQKNAVLRGPGYASPVKFWMPFNGGIGLHDASWRQTFGGVVYKTNGSHGCVNLPYDMANVLYENVYVGIPVICYN